MGKRQVEELTARSAADVDAFYEAVEKDVAEDGDVLVISRAPRAAVVQDGLRTDFIFDAS